MGAQPICPICERRIGQRDHVTSRRIRNPPFDADRLLDASPASGGTGLWWVHIGCTGDGVKRWMRAGRPCESAVDWIRQNGLSWTGLDSAGYRGGMVGAPLLEEA